jgi:hypothetical protein
MAPSEEERQNYRATLLTMLRDAVKVELSTIPVRCFSLVFAAEAIPIILLLI